MKRKIATITGALLVFLGLGIVAANNPAWAAASNCPQGTLCAWDDSNFNVMLFSHVQSPGTCYNVPGNDRANGFYNRMASPRHVQFYKDANCTGPLLRDWNGNHGPFGPGALSLFFKAVYCGDCDQNKLSSVWFNNV